MEDNMKILRNLMMSFLIFATMLTSCVKNGNMDTEMWRMAKIKDGVNLFYRSDSLMSTPSFVFINRKNSECYDICFSKDIYQYEKFLPMEIRRTITKGKRLKNYDGNYLLSQFESCLRYSSKFYNLDSLSAITCSTCDFPELSINFTIRYKNNVCNDNIDAIIHKDRISALIKLRFNQKLKKFNLTAFNISKQPEGLCFYSNRNSTNNNVSIKNDSSILFVPLVVDIKNIVKNK